jgi:methionine aminopeptidase
MVGRYVQLKSPPHGFAAAYPLMELNPNILDPGDTEITLGATIKAASDIAHDNQSSFEEKIEQTKGELIDQAISSVTETTKEQIASVIHTAEQIILSAMESYAKTSDLESFRQTIESQFSVMSNEISMKFTQVTEQIVDVNGDLQKTVETLQKHFDFGIDGLAIRAGANSMSLRLDNDLIIFEKNGQQFGWWDGVDFHTGNIIIDVNERVQFGNFAAIPRSTGNLSWMKVRG